MNKDEVSYQERKLTQIDSFLTYDCEPSASANPLHAKSDCCSAKCSRNSCCIVVRVIYIWNDLLTRCERIGVGNHVLVSSLLGVWYRRKRVEYSL